MLLKLTSMSPPPTWLLVAGHYPIFSKGSHGDTAELKQYLLPLLLKYKVHAYICGHDHISEHLQFGSLHAFVAGAGSMTDELKANSNATLLWSGTGYSAFAAVIASATELNVSFVDTSSSIRYSYVLGTDTLASSQPLVPVVPRFGWRKGPKRQSNALLLSLVGFGAVIALVAVAGSARCTWCGKKRFESEASDSTPSSSDSPSPLPSSSLSSSSPLQSPSPPSSTESLIVESPALYPIPHHHRQYQYEQQHRRGGISGAFSSMSSWSQAGTGSGFNMESIYGDVLLEDSNGDLRVVKLLLSPSTEEELSGSSPSSSSSPLSQTTSASRNRSTMESDIEDRSSEISASFNNNRTGWQYSPKAGYFFNLQTDKQTLDARPTHFRRFST